MKETPAALFFIAAMSIIDPTLAKSKAGVRAKYKRARKIQLLLRKGFTGSCGKCTLLDCVSCSTLKEAQQIFPILKSKDEKRQEEARIGGKIYAELIDRVSEQTHRTHRPWIVQSIAFSTIQFEINWEQEFGAPFPAQTTPQLEEEVYF